MLAAACRLAGLTEHVLLGRSHGAEFVTWCQAVMHVAFLAGGSNVPLARRLDHNVSTVSNDRWRAVVRSRRDPAYAERLAALVEAAGDVKAARDAPHAPGGGPSKRSTQPRRSAPEGANEDDHQSRCARRNLAPTRRFACGAAGRGRRPSGLHRLI